MVQQKNYHHGNLRSAILKKAAQRLERLGREGLSLRDLARACGVSHTAPYRHFPTRDSLLEALAIDGYRDLAARFDALFATEGMSARERLVRGAGEYVAFGTERPALATLLFAERRPEAASNAWAEASKEPYFRLERLIADCVAEGSLPAAAGKDYVMLAWSFVEGIASLCRGHRSILENAPSPRNLAEHLAARWLADLR